MSSGNPSSVTDEYHYGDWDSSSESGDEDNQYDGMADEAPSSYNTLDPNVASSAEDETIRSNSSTSDLDSVDGSPTTEDKPEGKIMAARAYQLEMLEESLKRNIIVAMDTGSGKTQVAVLRIIHELERTPAQAMVWFLTTTVALCHQQYDVLRTQIPAANIKILTGDHGVDNWSKREIWDKALADVRIVTSTEKILLDALIHAFVRLESLSLIVFDEAHYCIKKHPYKRIMTEFYHLAKDKGHAVPSILGLTASPIISSNLRGLEELERTLDAVCRGPTQHREELLAHVNRPSMLTVSYMATGEGSTQNMRSLHAALQAMDIMQDPYIKCLQAQNTEQSRQKLSEALGATKPTNCHKQLHSLYRRSCDIFSELGSWAADYYISKVAQNAIAAAERPDTLSSSSLPDAEKRYVADIMRNVDAKMHPEPSPDATELSDKFQTLCRILLSFEGDPTGIVFVKERATAVVLSHLLSVYSATRDRFKVAPVVGASAWRGKVNLIDLPQKEDLMTLEKFRTRRINLLVATTVLEEGIDVPACNLVICMEKPANLKSFIQRRGRARTRTSKLYLLFDEGSRDSVMEWQRLEAEMRRKYEDNMRELDEMEEQEESEVPEFPPLEVEHTKAKLTIDDARSHLDHFCATLSSRKFVDCKPDYIIHKIQKDELTTLFTATVVLPVSLPATLRRAESSREWRSQKNACKDAAFQAYKAIHAEGLLNDHLLPLRETDLSRDVEGRVGIATASCPLNPWRKVAAAWVESQRVYQRPLRLVDHQGDILCTANMLLPVPIPDIGALSLYWRHSSPHPWDIELGLQKVTSTVAKTDMGSDHTNTLLALSYRHRWDLPTKHQLVRFECPGTALGLHQLGGRQFTDLKPSDAHKYLLRDASDKPYLNTGQELAAKPAKDLVKETYRGYEECDEGVPHVVVKKYPKKTGFLKTPKPSQEQPTSTSTKTYPYVLPIPECRVDSIPIEFAQLGSLIPHLTRTLEVYLVAKELQTETRIRELGISDLSLIATAISAPSARERTNYERIEFLGDSILKLCTTINCAAQNLNYPEGYLSLLKDQLVCNARLCRAAIEFTLDRYIITKQYSLREWRNLYATDLLAPESEPEAVPRTRQLSTKTLADVVEALIGASYIHGDDYNLGRALQCIALFLPEMDWQMPEAGRAALYGACPPDLRLWPELETLEELLGYTFTKKGLLIEAVTHASYNVRETTACLERLEFIGDALLDNVVVNRLWAFDNPPLEHSDLHLLRSALVNRDFLALVALRWSVTKPAWEVTTAPTTPTACAASPVSITETTRDWPLWRFMRHMSSELGIEAAQAAGRHTMLRADLDAALDHGTAYPWALLARLQAGKYFSDLFEAVLGAVWVDSGDIKACEAVVEKAGIFPYLDRLLRDRVKILHPKEELGQLADRERVRYDIEVISHEGGEREFVCRVYIGDRLLVEVDEGVTRTEVKVKAAEEGLRLWKAGYRGEEQAVK